MRSLNGIFIGEPNTKIAHEITFISYYMLRIGAMLARSAAGSLS